MSRTSARWRPRVAAFAILGLATWILKVGEPAHAVLSEGGHDVPIRLGLWTGRPLEVTDRAKEILETGDVALMEYRLGNEPPVWFAQVAGFGTRAAFHPPELCYIGSHFEVVEREPITILVHGARQRVMRLVIAQNGERFEAWYWFTANGRMTPNYYQQQIWLVTDAMRQRPMSGNLVRISTILNNPLASRRRLLAFVTSLETPAHQLVRHEL